MKDIEKLRSEIIARLTEKGWKDAIRIVKKFDDPIDVEAAYEWSKYINDGWAEAAFIEAILD